MEPELLTGKEAARLLRVSRDMVYWLAARGDLPGRKVGRAWRFCKKTIAKQRVSAGIFLPIIGRTVVLLALLGLIAGRANAQGQDDIARLKEALETQQVLNQKLLKRIEALEASQGAILAKIQSVEESIPDEDMLREERDSIVEGIQEEYFDL